MSTSTPVEIKADTDPARRVLVVAPGVNTRGGIASVVRLHMTLPVWREMNCDLLSTFEDGSALRKLAAALFAWLRAPLKVAQADIVHLHMAGEVSLLRKLPIAAVARVLRKPLIVHVHASSAESLFDKTPSWAVRFVLGRADRVVALSASWASLMRAQLPYARIVVLPNPVQNLPRVTPYMDRSRIVLFTGKLEARKGYMTLLQAAPEVLRKHPDVQFWFAGHGELEQAAAEAARLEITSAVRLLGWTDHRELSALYEKSAVFCLPSRNEGLPMSVLEAMSHGAAVVCTPVGAIPEVITDATNGLLAEVDQPGSVAEKLLQLFDDPDSAASIADNGHRSIQEFCGSDLIDSSLRQLYDGIYEEIAESPLASPGYLP